jgi:hypothetical protein
MPCSLDPPTLPYSSYAEYVDKLSRFDKGYDGIHCFFAPTDSGTDGKILMQSPEEPPPPTQVVSIIDILEGRTVFTSRESSDGQNNMETNSLSELLASRADRSNPRIVFVSYWRDWNHGRGNLIDRDAMDKLALFYRIHPEILQLHFASSYGLDRYFNSKPSYTLSPSVAEQYVHLEYGHGFLSAHIHGSCSCSNSNTGMLAIFNWLALCTY